MLEVLLLILAGILLGTFTGMVPGIHVNTVVIVLLSLLPVLLEYFSPLEVVSLIVAMSVVHTFVDYIPSILIGAPQEDSVLSILPGHRMLMEGRGYEAIRLTVLGGFGAIVVSCVTLPAGMIILPILYGVTKAIMPYLLIAVLAYMVYSERTPKKMLYSLAIIGYSGILGVLILNGNVLPPKYSLFPTLTGLFGISTLLASLRHETVVPPQTLDYDDSPYRQSIAAGSVAGALTGLLPGVGSSQSALIVQNAFKDKNEREFLVAIGGVNTSDAIYSIFALYLIGNPRSGASIAVEHILKEFTFQDFLFIVAVVLIVTPFATCVTLALARISVGRLQNLDYAKFSKYVLCFLFVFILAMTGLRGILIAATATAIGLVAAVTGIKRSHCMAVLVVPTILYFL
ncbi:MAG: tripartite tricarboxylate transporter permease [Candidatus Hydrothermarchaeaceae archaeon]